MSKYFIGLMTGTSADSIDGCVVDFRNGFEIINSKSKNLEQGYKSKYEESIKKGFKEIVDDEMVLELEQILNDSSIELICDLLKEEEIDISLISCIGFPGQTMFHDDSRSYQIGNAQLIADKVGINVMHDFRNYDMKKGGLGAPLVPEFHKYLFAEPDKRKIVINVGGISNGTYLDDNNIKIASDIGPGNCLMDLIAKRDFGMAYDDQGETAAKGQINQKLLSELLNKVRNAGYPRADDKSFYYNLNDFETDTSENLLATLSELTAICISDFCNAYEVPDEILLHGGGARNKFLMKRLNKHIGVTLKLTDHIISSKFVESAAFAYLAFLEKGKLVLPKQ